MAWQSIDIRGGCEDEDGEFMHGFIEGTTEWPQTSRTAMQDRSIGKSVVQISGAIPAAAYLQVPATGSLKLSGRYLYAQVGLGSLKWAPALVLHASC